MSGSPGVHPFFLEDLDTPDVDEGTAAAGVVVEEEEAMVGGGG